MLDNLAYLFIGAALLILIVVVLLKKTATTKASDPGSSQKPEPKKLEVQKPEDNGPKITYGPIYLYFGSQTGTANNFAKLLAEEAATHQFQPIVADLQEFEPETFVTPKVAIFCMATQGEGEPTDNAEKFYKWLSAEDREEGILKHLKFSVFGLGNKQYQFYNAMGKKTDAFMDKFGAERIYRYGEGDDDGSLEDDFNEWKTELWKELKEKIKAVAIDQAKKSEEQLPFNIILGQEELKEVDFDNLEGENKSGKEFDFQAKTYLACKNVKITKAYELRQNNDEGSTLHVEFDVGNAGLKYQTASNVYVFPENDPKFVEEIALRIGAKLDQTFIIEENKENISPIKFKHPVPTPITVRNYLSHFCDLQGPVKKSTLKNLAKFIENEDKKQKLLRLATAAGKEEYENEIAKPMKGIYDLIFEYDINLDLKKLIFVADNIKPRYFTIASSAIKTPENLHVCASLLEFKSGEKWRPGLVSGYFRRMLEHFLKNPGTHINARANVKDSTFLLPTDASRPLILVGPGAGLAPFRGFLHEKEYLIQQGDNKLYGEITLYFGCRKTNSDYIYKEELEKFYKDGIVNRYYTAFSREEDQKCYVQDLMKKNSEELAKTLFDQNGLLYICGSIRMGNDVIKCMNQLATEHLKVSGLEGALKVKQLEQDKRIIKELWE